ncbi:MAG: UvrD-helicase domain-containing protein [Prevotella sp.]
MKNIPLTVYKASAGSGKTFTLATEYIKLLIANPICFKNILAVTFTNKATEEMKNRILSQLYGIWRNLPDSEPYINVITHDLGISRKQAAYKAEEALKLLIHNYNYFRVETIDSFFQSVLRNLARELDLTPNLKTSLNDYEVEEDAVDRLIESLTTSSKMLNWLLNYINSNIDDNKTWNVVNQLKDFGHTIFSDFYKKAAEKLNEAVNRTGFFEKYNSVLHHLADGAKQTMSNYADEFETALNKADITPDYLSGKQKGIYSYFEKLRSNDFSDARCMNKTLEKHLSDADNWISKTNKDRERLVDIVNDTLLPILKRAETDRQQMWRNYCSAMQTLRHLYKVRLLSNIESKVRELNNDANRFLLSDTQYLLNELIDDNDTPFVFEKIGCQLKHIMIDEFQDTSTVQWQNFKVLLKECMSHHDDTATEDRYQGIISNLIVGDVKQSIYRWRAGDWRLLNNIEKQLYPYHDTIEIKSLTTNFRSKGNIIEFNNRFFELAAKYEYEKEKDICDEQSARQIMTAYCDVVQQKRNDNHEGLVRVCLFDSEDYDLDMMKHIENCIDDILTAGSKMGDIAILVRFNRHIPAIAEYFMNNRPELLLISDEAFRLENSMAVRIIIKALAVIADRNDVLARTALATAYQKDILGYDSRSESIIVDMSNDPALTDKMLPEDFIKNIDKIAARPLQDMVEDIFNAFKLYELVNESAYICAFSDCIAEFTANNMDSVSAFLKEWDERLNIKTIQSDGVDAIRLISIHKSKGLEFDNVIIPYCDWKLENNRNTLWCKPNQPPYNELPIVPIDYSKKLLETIYDEDYREEHMQNIVDNLNLLYVAMTRAGNNLFVLGSLHSNQGNRSEIIERCLSELSVLLPNSVYKEIGENETLFEFGRIYAGNTDHKKDKNTDNVFLKPELPIGFNYCKRAKAPVFRQSNKSIDFIAGKDDDNEKNEYIKIGCILHRLFSMIKTTDDIDEVLTQFELDGILYNKGLSAEKLKTMLNERLRDKRIATWFSNKWHVFNECSILSAGIKSDNQAVIEHRPDRVITDGNTTIVIDFKFGKRNERYIRQVSEYMSLLNNMGHKNVKGYIWYVYSNIIEEVTGIIK